MEISLFLLHEIALDKADVSDLGSVSFFLLDLCLEIFRYSSTAHHLKAVAISQMFITGKEDSGISNLKPLPLPWRRAKGENKNIPSSKRGNNYPLPSTKPGRKSLFPKISSPASTEPGGKEPDVPYDQEKPKESHRKTLPSTEPERKPGDVQLKPFLPPGMEPDGKKENVP